MKKTIIFGTLFLTMLSCGSDEKKEAKKPKATVILPLIKAAKAEKQVLPTKFQFKEMLKAARTFY